MAENEAVEAGAAEVEMCDCGCGHTKEETVQMLMLLRGGDREDAERAYEELGEQISEEDKEARDFLSEFLQHLEQRQREEAEAAAEGQRAREAGEEMCPCDCGRSRAQVVAGMMETGLSDEEANALYEKCAAVERENPGGVSPETMQRFLNEVAPGRFEVMPGE